ncbi:MAG: hypothetical protein RL701_8065, partial [Pseudomonadota bacterium]
VNDRAEMLTPVERKVLDARLREYQHVSGHQLVFLSIRSLRGTPLEQYSERVATAWKLGRAGVDDGLLLLAVRDDRQLRIEVGYGLEGDIPDAVASRIEREQLVPGFQAGRFGEGVRSAFEHLIAAADHAGVRELAPLVDRPRLVLPFETPAASSTPPAGHGTPPAGTPDWLVNTLIGLMLSLVFVLFVVIHRRNRQVQGLPPRSWWAYPFLFLYGALKGVLMTALALVVGANRREEPQPTTLPTHRYGSGGSGDSGGNRVGSTEGGGGTFGGGGASASW